MTMLQRLLRAVKSNAGLNPNFEHYYSRLMSSGDGLSGQPTAREAQRDHDAALTNHHLYTLL